MDCKGRTVSMHSSLRLPDSTSMSSSTSLARFLVDSRPTADIPLLFWNTRPLTSNHDFRDVHLFDGPKRLAVRATNEPAGSRGLPSNRHIRKILNLAEASRGDVFYDL